MISRARPKAPPARPIVPASRSIGVGAGVAGLARVLAGVRVDAGVAGLACVVAAFGVAFRAGLVGADLVRADLVGAGVVRAGKTCVVVAE